MRQIAPGVYAHEAEVAETDATNQGDIANLGLVIGERGVAVIDTGGSVAVGKLFLEAIRRLTDKPILYVVNTHEHPDHVFGDAAFLAQGAVFVGHKNLPRALAARGGYYLKSFQPLLGAAAIAQTRVVTPTVLVETTLTLDLGGRTLTLTAWPTGHTDCDLTVYDVLTRSLFAGDLVFNTHMPVIDGSLKGWMINLDRLAAIPALRVIPGHGPVGEAWPDALSDERRYFQTLKRDIDVALKTGEDMRHAADHAAQSERDKWRLFDVYNARNAATAYAEQEWEP